MTLLDCVLSTCKEMVLLNLDGQLDAMGHIQTSNSLELGIMKPKKNSMKNGKSLITYRV